MQWTPESLRATIGSTQALADAFATANANGSGTIRGEQAVKFLRPSGLSDGALSRIWKLSTRGTGSLGSPAALAECLELVAKELENPSDGALVSTPAGHVKSAGGLSAGTPRTPASASVESVQAAPMTEAERKKYFGHFRTLDTQGKGTVSVDGAVKFLSKASLPLLSVQLCVARASRGASTIDRDMFAVAMHDVYALIRAQGKTPLTPALTPAAQAPAQSEPAKSSTALDDNFFSSMGAPSGGVSAIDSAVKSSDSLLGGLSAASPAPSVRIDEANRLEREAEEKARAAERDVKAAEAAKSAAEARIARAKQAISVADEDVASARLAVEAAEAEADRLKRDATARLEQAKRQHAELIDKESHIKRDTQRMLVEKKAEYQAKLAELDRLRAQIANATSVASVPVKAMQDKLNAIEEESRGLRMQTDKAAADASQFLVKKAVDVAKAERAKAAAQRELQAVEAKLEMETARIEKQLEALQADADAMTAKREARTAAHPGIVEALQEKVAKTKERSSEEKEKTEITIAGYDKEVAELEAKVALAKAELEAASSVMQSDLATHKLKLDEKRISHEEVMEAVRQATEKRKRLADTQASEIVALDDKIAEADAALKAEEAAMNAQERAHEDEMSKKETVLAGLNSKIDALRVSMEDQYLASQKALTDIEARIDAAELKHQEQQQEMDLATTKLASESDELQDKLQIAKEKEERNAKDKVEHATVIGKKQAEVDELKAELSAESARIEAEISETESEFARANAALDVERAGLSEALARLRETLPKSAAVIAQIRAVESAKDSAALHRNEAETTAENALATYEEVLKRLEVVAIEAAETASDDKPSFAAERDALSFASAAAPIERATSHERLPSFVEFEVSPVAGEKTSGFTAASEFDDVFGEPPSDDVFAGAAPELETNDDEFDDASLTVAPVAERQFRSFSLDDEPAREEAAPEPQQEVAFGDFEEFKPEPVAGFTNFEGADAFEAPPQASVQQEDPFATDAPAATDAGFTTFDNDAFQTSGGGAQWDDDFTASPPREEIAWNPDQSVTDDAFQTAQKPDDAFASGAFELETPGESVFATPSALTFQGAQDDSFGADEPVASPAPEDYADAREEVEYDDDEDEDPTVVPQIPLEDFTRSQAAWGKLRTDAGSEGVTGEQIVSLATKTGLDNSDLAIIWNISCTAGASELSMADFALFMHFLKHRVNGGVLPEQISAEERAYYLGESEVEVADSPAHIEAYAEETGAPSSSAGPSAPERQTSTSSGESNRLKIFIESVANVKDAAKMSSTHFSVTLVDGEGTPLEPSQNTAIGVQTSPDGVMRVQSGVTLNSIPENWPEGSAVILELKHFKEKEKKMSTRCWSFMEKDAVRAGLFGLPLAAKPSDAKRRKVKFYNKGNPDLKVRFTLVGTDAP